MRKSQVQAGLSLELPYISPRPGFFADGKGRTLLYSIFTIQLSRLER